MLHRMKHLVLVAALAAATIACETNDGDGGGATGGSVGGAGGSGGTGGAGGSGGSGGETGACVVDADCAADEFCVGPAGARRCAVLCTSDDDCSGDEICTQVAENGATICQPPTIDPPCGVDADCAAPELCVDGFCVLPLACEEDEDCLDAGERCEGGICVPVENPTTCESTPECYEEVAYCADLGGTTACIDVSCGSSLNACGRCALGPNEGARDPGGPLLFFPQQLGACEQDPDACLPGAAPLRCTFTFLAYDPDGDLPTSGLNERIRQISRTGALLSTFGTSASPGETWVSYTFSACFAESPSGLVSTAVVLADDAGNESQSLCIEGALQ